jgi:hypothetical protein
MNCFHAARDGTMAPCDDRFKVIVCNDGPDGPGFTRL